MSSTMDAGGCENQEAVPNNLRKQIALAVKAIQWSYAIFWSSSSKNPGVLEWSDGYYNGDIKTRKTVQAGEVNSDEQGLQRSEQLKELYEALLAGESNPQTKRPSAALSPEDLTDTEWYYLICMSFTYNIGQCLPGRMLKKNQTIWLSNAHQADTKVFSRSLLAKSASIQTVVCFPHLGGVVEVGTTEQVPEDLNLVHLMQTSMSEISCPVVDNNSSHVSEDAKDKYVSSAKFDNDVLESGINPPVEVQVVLIGSPNNGSNGYETVKHAGDSYIEGINGEASRAFGDRLIEEDIPSHLPLSVNSADSISQKDGKQEKICLISNGEKANQESEQNMNSSDSRPEDIHYHGILSNLLKSSHQLILGPYFRNRNRDSRFTSWRKDGLHCIMKPQPVTPQKLLKKVLIEVSKMHESTFVGSMKDDDKIERVCQIEEIKNEEKCGLSEQNHREKINDRFKILSSLVPSSGKVDKVSILDGTIEYLMELKRRINEPESNKEVIPKTRKPSDASERTSDNYFSNKGSQLGECSSGKRGHTNKRKVCEIDCDEPPRKRSQLGKCSSDDISVYMIDKEIMIDLKFPSSDGVLLRIMKVVSSFHLDYSSIQSSNSEDIISVSIRSKPKGLKLPSVAQIKEALQRVVHNR